MNAAQAANTISVQNIMACSYGLPPRPNFAPFG
jgi:hypothetical protein